MSESSVDMTGPPVLTCHREGSTQYAGRHMTQSNTVILPLPLWHLEFPRKTLISLAIGNSSPDALQGPGSGAT